MFGVDWGNAQTLGVNLTNLILGIVTLAFLAVTALGIAVDLYGQHHRLTHADHAGSKPRLIFRK